MQSHASTTLAGSTTLSLLLLLLSLPAAATPLISVDDPVWGPGSITRDTISGLEWLDVDLSGGLSHNQLVLELQPGGRFDGWIYADITTALELWVNAGLPGVICSGCQPRGEQRESVIDLIALAGANAEDDWGDDALWAGLNWYAGLHDEDDPNTYRLFYASYFEAGRLEYDLLAGEDEVLPGHWLYRQSAVIPEPGTGLLLMAGLVVMGMRSRLLV